MRRLREEDEAPQPTSALRDEAVSIVSIGAPLMLANLLDRLSLWITWAMIGQHGGADELGPAVHA